MISQGDIWWADLGDPVGSSPGYLRPVVVIQGDAINQSRIATLVCVPLTSNAKWANAPGIVPLTAAKTGLDKLSFANASLIVAIDRLQLIDRAGRLPRAQVEQIFTAIDVILGR